MILFFSLVFGKNFKKTTNFKLVVFFYSATCTGKYFTPHAKASACEFMYTSILFP